MLNERQRQYVFLCVILTIFVCVCYSVWEGSQQQRNFREDYEQYYQAFLFIKQSNGTEALKLLEPIAERYPDRYNIVRFVGLAYALTGDFQKASLYYEKAITLRPFLQEDPVFTLQYGEISYFNGEYQKAQVYLEKCRNTPGSEEFHIRIDELLNAINQQKTEEY
ncbi:tetratricopeptide repeat protein [Anoxybacillus flavithermus]|uniref:tetratricopeptide repeat protein n=1 Tax=Anoxybacillus TaxID=150247 RepID=UPI00036CC84E|nr:hypothetical protein [Anoxybacillus flavithermus]AXM89094.1 tetratricopeptide repeat protein [Anoxybacillus ayderensis G10]MBE2940089.1 hypothetical protein [Anoxybacillus flavithermus]MBE2942842.1 hypothetical protein [Anoxybacillus flavithermus]MBE2951172.1 hypothetical protein [Anoxybacillus flavithermus]MBE2953830.1 hypothetical protein [Anoxybacillus flavithermus]